MSPFRFVDDLNGFLKVLIKSGLIEKEQRRHVFASFRDAYPKGQDGPDELAVLCKFLVARDVLTVWQCNKLRHGQYKGFFVDEFRLLDRAGVDGDDTLYLAEDLRSGGYVHLGVEPLGKSNEVGPIGFNYRVKSRFSAIHQAG